MWDLDICVIVLVGCGILTSVSDVGRHLSRFKILWCWRWHVIYFLHLFICSYTNILLLSFGFKPVYVFWNNIFCALIYNPLLNFFSHPVHLTKLADVDVSAISTTVAVAHIRWTGNPADEMVTVWRATTVGSVLARRKSNQEQRVGKSYIIYI